MSKVKEEERERMNILWSNRFEKWSHSSLEIHYYNTNSRSTSSLSSTELSSETPKQNKTWLLLR